MRALAACALELRAARGRPRVPEPMVMDEPDAAAEYDAAGILAPLHDHVARTMERMLPPRGRLVDLGSGSGRLLARLAERRPDVEIVGVERSPAMLAMARVTLPARISLREADLRELDAELLASADLVSCILTLHHLSTAAARRCLEQLSHARQLLLFDFARLRRDETWPKLLGLLSRQTSGERFVADAIASERAAFTTAELRDLCREAGLTEVRHRVTRPISVFQELATPSAGRLSKPEGLLARALEASLAVAR